MCDQVTKEIRTALEKIEQRFMSIQSPWFTVKEACEYLRCGQSHVYQLMKAGKLKYTRLSDGKTKGKVIFHKHWLTAAALGYGRKLSPTQAREVNYLE